MTPPPKPEAGDCCGGGCANCVFDVYEAQLARYEAALEQWRRGRAKGEEEAPIAAPPAP